MWVEGELVGYTEKICRDCEDRLEKRNWEKRSNE